MVASVPEPALMTIEEYDAIPWEGKRHELIGGVLLWHETPLVDHQEIVLRLMIQMDAAARPNRQGRTILGPIDVRFSRLDAVQPDVVFVRRDHRERLRDNGVHGAPDVVVEVVSPWNRDHDLVDKVRLYERFGVPEYWVCDPELRTIHLFILIDGRYAHASPVDACYHSSAITGLTVLPDALFAHLDDR